jgi:hypothetical protein
VHLTLGRAIAGNTPLLPDRLEVRRFAGVRRTGAGIELLGSALAFDQLPKRETRRLSHFERAAASVVMGLGNDLADTPIVFASRHGGMGNTLALLKDLQAATVLSPTAFSLSVHNAAAGLASQFTGNRGGHTALAAGARTVQAGLIETACRLADETGQVAAVFADDRLGDEYAAFDTRTDDICLGLLIAAAPVVAERSSAQSIAADADIDALWRIVSGGGTCIQWTL